MHGTRVQHLSQSVDLLALHAQQPERYPYLLESSCGPTSSVGQQGRYDLLFACPIGYLSLCADGSLQASGFVPEGSDFLTNLDRWFAQDTVLPGGGLPFQGGWFLFLGYELASQIEPILELPAATMDMPIAIAVRCPAAIIHDRLLASTFLVAETGHASLLDVMLQDISRLENPGQPVPLPPIRAKIREDDPERYIASVDRVRAYIQAGDIFQANLSRSWQIELQQETEAALLYRRLRQSNPAPFSGLMCWNDMAVICSSPERLVHSRAGLVETRPIAGTRPRHADGAVDQQQAETLLGHPKERAEHVMLIDLGRNDLGRIADTGSVRVNEFMQLESYAHVHHIVSNVQGSLANGVTPGAIIRAVFPGGTITGCPKIRCMQIIGELETEGRSAYTGSMGYLDRSGALDLNILIRTLVLQGRLGWLRTGAGIVADSEPRRELEETRAKAKGVLCLFEAIA